MDNTTYVFVYGSLKRGFHNYPVMAQAEGGFVSEATLPYARLFNLGAFPAVQGSVTPGENVTGELFRVDTPGLHLLDQLEGHPRYYRRELRSVVLADGTPQDAWVYFYPREIDPARYIPSGTWTQEDVAGVNWKER